MNRENEIFEKEMLGKSLREMFFELNVETEDRFQKIKDDFLKVNILRNRVPENDKMPQGSILFQSNLLILYSLIKNPSS